MKFKFVLVATGCAALFLSMGRTVLAADAADNDEARQPHTPTLIFYLSGAENQNDVDAIRASVQKLKSAAAIEVNTNRSYARIRFDSHVVSYHQVAQAVSDAGKTLEKSYDPYLVFFVLEYARSNNAAKVDAIFAGKRLNTRVRVKPLDKTKDEFSVHFLPLKIDPTESAPQGFNGGHLHHPVSDPPPRGLGLTSGYAANYDDHVREGAAEAKAAY
jgi:copper chaperone CopZ